MVLKQATKEGKKRGTAWSDDETRCLLAIWEENSIEEQLENPKTNNGCIYKTVATEMAEKGFERTSDQCKIRIHTLKRSYRECKASMKKSGKGRKTCKFFEELDSILGTRPASSPLKVIETLSKKTVLEEADESEGEDIASMNNDDFSDITPLENEDVPRDEKDSPDTENQKDESSVEKKKNKESVGEKGIVKNEKKRLRKTELEVALKSVMDGFAAANEKAEDKIVNLERQKLDLEKQKLDLEKAKMESEERQKREEREHQFNMMKMIMGAMEQRQTGHPHPMSSFAMGTRQTPYSEGQIYRGQDPSSLSSSGRGQSSVSVHSWASTDPDNQHETNYFNL